jgi:hypothetical protein
MANKQRPLQTRRGDKPASALRPGRNAAQPEENLSETLLDAITEIVHQGYGRLLDASELRAALDGWKPNCSMNFEYVFAWNPSVDPAALEINWKRPQLRILRRVVKDAIREEKILSGTPMTEVEQQAYRLELARRKHGYQSAEECLDSGANCKWVDLSFLTDRKERAVYVLEIGDAASTEDVDVDSIIDRHEEIWQWKAQPLTIAGPFASSEDAEEWMAENGAFKEAD